MKLLRYGLLCGALLMSSISQPIQANNTHTDDAMLMVSILLAATGVCLMSKIADSKVSNKWANFFCGSLMVVAGLLGLHRKELTEILIKIIDQLQKGYPIDVAYTFGRKSFEVWVNDVTNALAKKA